MEKKTFKTLITVKELSALLGVSGRAIYHRIKQNYLPVIHSGNWSELKDRKPQYLFGEFEVEEWRKEFDKTGKYEPDYIGVSELAKILEIKRDTVYKHLNKGELPKIEVNISRGVMGGFTKQKTRILFSRDFIEIWKKAGIGRKGKRKNEKRKD